MPVETYKVYIYRCDCPGCDNETSVEDRGGNTGRQPVGIFTGTVTFNTDKEFKRANWVACMLEHISGAQEHMVKESLGNTK